MVREDRFEAVSGKRNCSVIRRIWRSMCLAVSIFTFYSVALILTRSHALKEVLVVSAKYNLMP